MVIENNTMLGTSIGAGLYTDVNTAGSGTNYNPRDTVIRNNVIHSGTTYGFKGSGTSQHDTLSQNVCSTSPCPVSQWDRNVFAGLNKTTYSTSSGLLYNLCAATNCAGGKDWTLIYPRYTYGDYTVGSSLSTFKRADTNGRDFGVDRTQLAEIRNLTVTPSDRMVLFTWSVSIPIRDIPCVVEVNTKPWFDAAYYAGEQAAAQIGSYPRYDADDHDRNPRVGLSRQIVVGHTVNLTASTLYHYRLQCGGDATTGEFTTSAALSSTGTLRASNAAASSMTWGYSYSRATDTIASAAAGTCAAGRCTATADKGKVAYWRFGSGPVRSAVIQ
jgi:hypothetical protein